MTDSKAREKTLDEREQDISERERKLEETVKAKNRELQEKVAVAKSELEKEKGEFKARLLTENEEKIRNNWAKLASDIEAKYDGIFKQIEEKFAKMLEKNTQKSSELAEKEATLKAEKLKIENEYKQILQAKNEEKEQEFQADLIKRKEKVAEDIKQAFESREKLLDDKEQNLSKIQNEFKFKDLEISEKKRLLEKQMAEFEQNLKISHEKEKESLKQQLTRQIEENEVLRERISKTQDISNVDEYYEKKKLLDKNDMLEKQIKSLESQLKNLNKDYENLKSDKYSESQKYVKYLEKVENILVKNEEIQSENLALTAANKKMKDVEAHNQYLQNENTRINERLSQLQSQFLGESERGNREEAIKKGANFCKIKLDESNRFTPKDEIVYLDYIASQMQNYGVIYPKRILYAFHTALKSAAMSPLCVLSGVSGTGKSELPKLYAYYGGLNFLAEAVLPTWDCSESMIGYFNMLEGKFDATNLLKFFIQTTMDSDNNYGICGLKQGVNLILLDEMNLAHIELYFAEFLSKLEMRRSKNVSLDIKIGAGMYMSLPLDSNVLWVGTINEDETTKALSDKVLDRSSSIFFPRPKELISRQNQVKLDDKNFKWLDRRNWQSWIVENNNAIKLDGYKKIIQNINSHLGSVGKAIGHRVWQAMCYYIYNYPSVIKATKEKNEEELKKAVKNAFEDLLALKIAPKLRGIALHGKEKQALDEIVGELKDFKIQADFSDAMENPYGLFNFNSAKFMED